MTGESLQTDWIATREAGLARLEAFAPRAGRAYARNRNFDFGPDKRSNVSVLSPWIRHRLIREDEVVRTVLAQHRHADAEKFIQEVYWRTYWKGWLEQRPSVWSAFVAERDRQMAGLKTNNSLADRYARAISGDTGIAGFDDWARELVATGYLHNHARMWFASIWIFTLRLPWALGADFFMQHLCDADPASNTLSWRWVGGLQTRGKTYLARTGNIATYTDGRFAPKGLAPEAHPVDGPDHPPVQPIRWPEPVAGRRLLLAVTEDDCGPVSDDLLKRAVGVIRIDSGSDRAAGSLGAAARAFLNGALNDGAGRVAANGITDFGTITSDDPDGLSDALRTANADILSLPYVCVGPLRDRWPTLSAAVTRAEAAVSVRLHESDRRAWPKATKGFFAFKAHIPALIDAIEQPSLPI